MKATQAKCEANMGISEEQAKQMLGNKYPDKKKNPNKAKQKHKPKPAYRPGVMNKTEAEYAERLTADDEVLYWQFEKLTFKLAHRCTYTPDFLVIKSDCMEIHEVKGGFVRDDAIVKFKTAAEQHPHFKWILAQKKRKQWNVEEY